MQVSWKWNPFTLFNQKCFYFTFILGNFHWSWNSGLTLLFSPNILRVSLHYLLASVISGETLLSKSDCSFVTYVFLSGEFRIFIMIQQFYNVLISVCLFIFLGVHWAHWSCGFIFATNLENILLLLFKYIIFLCQALSPLLLGALITNMLNCFILLHKLLKALFIVHFLVSLFLFLWTLVFLVSTAVSSNSLIFSSVVSNLIVSPFSKFFHFRDCFSSSKISICLIFYFSFLYWDSSK